jgi:hypothetical protein
MVPQFEVAHCPRCNKIFRKTDRNQCPDCIRQYGAALIRCVDYLRRNYKATEEQIKQDTGVPVDFVQTWIKEGRLIISDYPNLNYPCNSCGKAIRQHKMCAECSTRLHQDIQKLNPYKRPEPEPILQQNAGTGFRIRDRIGRVNN